MSAYIKGKSKSEILTEMSSTAEPGSQIHEQQKAAIIVRSAEDLEAALDRLNESMINNAAASTGVASRLLWLNVVLALATVVLAIVAVLAFAQGGGS